jgi:hypothetical protein
MRLPVALLWRHDKGEQIGLSRQWWLEDDGALGGEFEMAPTPFAQNVADRPAARLVAPSISVRYDSEWSHHDPSDWNPYDGHLHLCRHVHATVEEVGLTPTLQLRTRILTVR